MGGPPWPPLIENAAPVMRGGHGGPPIQVFNIHRYSIFTGLQSSQALQSIGHGSEFLGQARRVLLSFIRLWAYDLVGSDLLYALSNYALTGLQPLVNDPH